MYKLIPVSWMSSLSADPQSAANIIWLLQSFPCALLWFSLQLITLCIITPSSVFVLEVFSLHSVFVYLSSVQQCLWRSGGWSHWQKKKQCISSLYNVNEHELYSVSSLPVCANDVCVLQIDSVHQKSQHCELFLQEKTDIMMCLPFYNTSYKSFFFKCS